jgi:peptidoglycan/LPS O-acetylase OafA/YrhL
MWTLVHEMRISVLFPLLAAAALVRPRWLLMAAVSMFIVFSITHLTLSIGAHLQPQALAEFFLSILQTLRYVLFFVFGILVVTQAPGISAFLRSSPAIKPALWVTAAILLAIPYTKGYTELAYAVGSFLLLNLCLNSDRARALLRNPVLQWLGRVSYSLYLTHLMVLLALVYTLYNVLPMWLILLLVLTVSLVTAEIFNRWIEMPSARLGKRMADRLRPATAQQFPA